MSYSRWANSRTIGCNSPRARRSRLTRGPSTDRRNKALGSIAFMGTHLVDEGYAAQLDSLGSDSGQTLWGVKSDRSAPSNRRSGAGHHGTTITRFSQVMASASDTDRQQVCQNSARSEEHTSELQSLMRISYAVFCLKKKTKNTNTKL